MGQALNRTFTGEQLKKELVKAANSERNNDPARPRRLRHGALEPVDVVGSPATIWRAIGQDSAARWRIYVQDDLRKVQRLAEEGSRAGRTFSRSPMTTTPNRACWPWPRCSALRRVPILTC